MSADLTLRCAVRGHERPAAVRRPRSVIAGAQALSSVPFVGGAIDGAGLTCHTFG